MKLITLREVVNLPIVVEDALDAAGDIVEYEDGTKWVDNDAPRDQAVTDAIMSHSGRFAVANPDMEMVGGPYADLKRAEYAKSTAKIKLAVDVEIDEPEAVEA